MTYTTCQVLLINEHWLKYISWLTNNVSILSLRTSWSYKLIPKCYVLFTNLHIQSLIFTLWTMILSIEQFRIKHKPSKTKISQRHQKWLICYSPGRTGTVFIGFWRHVPNTEDKYEIIGWNKIVVEQLGEQVSAVIRLLLLWKRDYCIVMFLTQSK